MVCFAFDDSEGIVEEDDEVASDRAPDDGAALSSVQTLSKDTDCVGGVEAYSA
jgi:hypothetical protein